jgi:ABC-type transporter Mla MlaB component
MRRSGMLESVAGLGVHDHVCWTFDDDEEFRSAALQWLEDGLRLGQRLLYVGASEVETLRADLEGLEDAEALIASGALLLVSLPAMADRSGRHDSAAWMAFYTAATDRAVADGYAGLRVAAEISPLVGDRDAWQPHARCESFADRYMTGRPLAALCCYDRRSVPEEALADIARFHPLVHGPERIAPFRLFATPDALALSGDLDRFSADALERLLGMAARPAGAAILDIGALEFIDHQGVLALIDQARADAPLTVRAAPEMVRRLCTMMDVAL